MTNSRYRTFQSPSCIVFFILYHVCVAQTFNNQLEAPPKVYIMCVMCLHMEFPQFYFRKFKNSRWPPPYDIIICKLDGQNHIQKEPWVIVNLFLIDSESLSLTTLMVYNIEIQNPKWPPFEKTSSPEMVKKTKTKIKYSN